MSSFTLVNKTHAEEKLKKKSTIPYFILMYNIFCGILTVEISIILYST